MTPQKRPKRSWSRREKQLMIVPGILSALAVTLFFWLLAVSAPPAPLPPPHSMPAVNARDSYLAAANALMDSSKINDAVMPSQTPVKPPSGQPPQPHSQPGRFPGGSFPAAHVYSLGEKASLVAANSQAISLLHQGFQYPYQELPITSFDMPTSQYAKFRQLARLLSLSAQVKAAQGDWKEAVNADLDAVQLGETLPRGGPLIGMLVGAACQSIGRKQVWQAMPHLSAAEAQAAARRLEAVRAAHVSFANTMQEEKWGTQTSLREVMAKPDWSRALFNTFEGTDYDALGEVETVPPSWWAQQAGSAYFQLLGKRHILANNAQWMDKVIAQARQPYPLHPTPPPLPNDLVSQILLPAYLKIRIREVSANTQNALLVTTLALQAYHQDHKAYPLSLTALVPGYLKSVPTDPFALSGLLRYKRVGAKYVLYSVGPDGKDDGGKAIFDSTKPPPSQSSTSDQRYWTQQDSTGDVVAGVNTL